MYEARVVQIMYESLPGTQATGTRVRFSTSRAWDIVKNDKIVNSAIFNTISSITKLVVVAFLQVFKFESSKLPVAMLRSHAVVHAYLSRLVRATVLLRRYTRPYSWQAREYVSGWRQPTPP
eukprot:422884-Rhodomonas_salina.3